MRFCPVCFSLLDPGNPCLVCKLVSVNRILSVTRKPVGMPTRKEPSSG